MPRPKLKDLIVEVLKQEGKPVPLHALVDAVIYEGYSQEEVEQAIDELEQSGFVRKGKIRTLYGEEPTLELIREPELKLEEFIEEEEVTLTPSEQRALEEEERKLEEMLRELETVAPPPKKPAKKPKPEIEERLKVRKQKCGQLGGKG